MLAEKDETMCSAAKSIYEIMAEQEAQLELEARERYIKEKKRYKEMEIELAEKDNKLAQNQKEIAEKDEELAQNKKALAQNKEELAHNQKKLVQKDEEIARLKAKLEAALQNQ